MLMPVSHFTKFIDCDVRSIFSLPHNNSRCFSFASFLLFVSFAILLSHSSAFVVVVVAVDIFAHFEHGQFQFYFGLTPSDTVL